MRKVGVVILVLIGIGIGAFFYLNQPKPQGQQDAKAAAMAEKMLDAIGIDAWHKIPFVAWTFQDKHHYIWDKERDLAAIKWDDYEVKLDLNTQKGVVLQSGEKRDGEAANEALEKAWAIWCNDSFWLNAPAKIHDPGTSLSRVVLEEGAEGLKVTYHSGGVTPGDTYVWVLDDAGLPKYCKMWVSVIPVGGVKATWTGWEIIDGAKISTQHKMGPVAITISNLKSGGNLTEMGLNADYFAKVVHLHSEF